MAYHDFPFPPSTPLYPRASIVLDYLRSYARHFDLRRHIQFNRRITSLERDELNDCWKLGLDDAPSCPSLYFDAIVLCQGRFKEPRFPNISGLQGWTKSERKCIHSISYREPSGFRGQRVLVVGAGPSGQDISTEISQTATLLLQSSTGAKRSNDKLVKQRARLVELRAEDGSAHYEDGTSDLDIDAVVFATGYKYSFPFFPLLHPSGTHDEADPIPPHLFNSTYHIHPLARHLFPLRDIPPSKLAFMSLLYKVAPFPAFEDQAQAIASVFLGKHQLNDHREELLVRKRFELLSRRCNGNLKQVAKTWHWVPADDPEIEDQYQYRTDLLEISGNDGFPPPPPWNRHIYLQRKKLRQIWVDLEKRGLGEQIVKGVGEGGEHEWVNLMYRLLNGHTSRITGVPSPERLGAHTLMKARL